MSAEDMDLTAVINTLENKRAALDSAIAALRNLISSGAMVTSDGVIPTTTASFGVSGGSSSEVPDGVFHGKSIPAAIKLYLEIVRSKKTAREISEGLKKGGLESTSKYFEKIVYATLDRLRKAGDVIKIGTAWGLPVWYPALMRAGAGVKAAKPRRGRPPKSAPKGPKLLIDKAKPERRKSKAEPSTGDMIDWFLRDNPGPHTDEEIRSATNIGNIQVARMVLGTLIKNGKVAKEGEKYRKAS